MEFFNTYFKLNENKTDLQTEIIAGATTFLTMAYIIVLNPIILSKGETGIPYAGVVTATILVAALSSILMGLYANLPFALAPGMGINAFFTYSVVMGMGVSWQTALGTVFISGLIFLLLSVFRIREMIVHAIPECIRFGVAGGIGLFLALIGLKEAGFIVHSDATLVTFGGFTPSVLIFLCGLALTSLLVVKKVRGSLLIGIAATTFLAYLNGRAWGSTMFVKIPESFVASPDFSLAFFKLNIVAALKPAMIGVIFTFLFTDMFDSISTFLGVAQVANLMDENGQPRNLRKALIVDAVSTTVSGLFGSSSGTTYIESASGVEEGGRTGLTAIITGLLFLPFLYLSPVIGMVPMLATSPVLVLVGFYMIGAVKKVNFKKMDEGIPAFLALIMIPLCYNITQGISWSFVFYVLLKLFTGKGKDIKPMLYVISVLAVLALVLT